MGIISRLAYPHIGQVMVDSRMTVFITSSLLNWTDYLFLPVITVEPEASPNEKRPGLSLPDDLTHCWRRY
ncbi:hypothetical protein OKW43_002633 [Paraburkholderia sp. WC7.3g]